MVLQKSKIITLVLITYSGVLIGSQTEKDLPTLIGEAIEENRLGSYEYVKTFPVLADDSLEFTQNGEHLVARKYAEETGYKKINTVITVKSGYSIKMGDAAVATLLQDKIPDLVHIYYPLIYCTNARGFQRMFSCIEDIDGNTIKEIGANPELTSIARSPDKNLIAVGYKKQQAVNLYALKACTSSQENKH